MNFENNWMSQSQMKFYEKTVNIVANLHPNSDHYDMLMNENAPETAVGKIQYLLAYWEELRRRGVKLNAEIHAYFLRKKKNLDFIPDLVGEMKDDFEQFLELDRKFNLRLYGAVFKGYDPVSEKCYKIKGLFLSPKDNYAGKHLNLYCWTRSRHLDLIYSDDDLCNMSTNISTRYNQRMETLNRHKRIMEMFHGKIIDKMFVVKIHPTCENGYEIREAGVIHGFKG